MSTSETKIKHLDNIPCKFKKNLYPIPNHNNVQKPYFICCAIGQRGSGKTYAVTKLLLNQEASGFRDAENGEPVEI
jgi:hypothetical protein